MGSLEAVQRLGQSVWYDNISRDLLASGEIEGLIKMGVTGLTSNPTIFEKAISSASDYDEALSALAREGLSTKDSYERLAMEDIRAAADLLRPAYDRTEGRDGYASLEVSPTLAHDTEATTSEALRLFAALDRPNAMIKVPATPEGIPAVRRLIGQGLNINVTLIFSLEAHSQVMEAYIAGLEDLAKAAGDLSKVASVASFFVSRVDTVVDNLLGARAQQGQTGLDALLGKAAIANAKLAYQSFKTAFGDDRFATLQAKGARVQRPLWASTGTKNPTYSDVLYIDNLIGENTVNTMPPATLNAFMEHGQAKATLEQDVADAEHTLEALDTAGISLIGITDKLLTDGVKSFADSFEQLLANIESKKAILLAQGDESRTSASGTTHP
jgi:transaldolase